LSKGINLSAEGTNLSGEVTNLSEEVTNLSEEVTNLSEEVTNLSEGVTNLSEEVINLSGEVINLSGEVIDESERQVDLSLEWCAPQARRRRAPLRAEALALTFTSPPLQASVASARCLKRQTSFSHMSTRYRSISCNYRIISAFAEET